MKTKKKIKEAAVEYYKEWVEGEPLTQEVPIDCFVEGAQYVTKENKKNYKKAMKNLEVLFLGLSDAQRLRIINNLRLCAGMPLVESSKNV